MKKLLLTVAPIYLVALLLIYTNEKGWVSFKPPLDRLLTEIGIALLAVGSIHILDHIILVPHTAKAIERQTKDFFGEELDSAANRIVDNVTGRTDAALQIASKQASEILERQVEAIKVMDRTNLTSIFADRSKASGLICQSMSSSAKVKLMGISLNEFLRSENQEFHRAWTELKRRIEEGKASAQILLIDPFCHGAVLRSYAETSVSEADPDRLENDVLRAADFLKRVRTKLGENASKLEVKLYRLSPTLFLCHFDETCFVQPYYFWTERKEGCPVPVLQYRKRTEKDLRICMHREFGEHFEFVWDHASTELERFVPMPTGLLEWGSHISGMESVFIDQSRANLRMRQEIECSKTLLIQGITLKAFFAEDGDLPDNIKRRIEAGVELQILLLDPDGEQAKERAFREFLLKKKTAIDFAQFVQKHYASSKLFTDLNSTIERIRAIQQTLGANNKVQAKKYGTAPHMFCLIGDNAAFVEQYSYGHVQNEAAPSEKNILGSDMPLIEYTKNLGPVYNRVVGDIRAKEDAGAKELRPLPYMLLQSHFKHAWQRATPI